MALGRQVADMRPNAKVIYGYRTYHADDDGYFELKNFEFVTPNGRTAFADLDESTSPNDLIMRLENCDRVVEGGYLIDPADCYFGAYTEDRAYPHEIVKMAGIADSMAGYKRNVCQGKIGFYPVSYSADVFVDGYGLRVFEVDFTTATTVEEIRRKIRAMAKDLEQQEFVTKKWSIHDFNGREMVSGRMGELGYKKDDQRLLVRFRQ